MWALAGFFSYLCFDNKKTTWANYFAFTSYFNGLFIALCWCIVFYSNGRICFVFIISFRVTGSRVENS